MCVRRLEGSIITSARQGAADELDGGRLEGPHVRGEFLQIQRSSGKPEKAEARSARHAVSASCGTPSTTPSIPSANPTHCHHANRSPSRYAPSAAVRIGWKACTSAAGVP